ncbi:MAG: hypothetical protein LBR30_07475, partial [Clostridioides sp.]|nr:hypothetical protein [Clostridioides sp.]
MGKPIDLKMGIKEMNLEERPREKMIANGVKYLSNAELLAIIIRTGSKGKNAVELASEIINLDSQGIRNLEYLTIEELCKIDGIGFSKATIIKASLELGKRVSSYKPSKFRITKPEDVFKIYSENLRFLDKEIFKAILLNTKNE